jgi:hypothetical protein
MTYTELLAPYDARVAEADGCYWEIRTRSLPALTPGAVDAIITAVARKTSPHSKVNWHHFHGAATRIPADATAFGLRREHFMVEIIAGWEPDGSNGAAHRQWAQDSGKASPRLHRPAATRICWRQMIENRSETPMAATAFG